MDVKTAFLNGHIKEELCMVQHKGFVDPKDADKICQRQRSIYGLKQASRSWNLWFDEVIKIYRDRSKRLIGLSQSTYLDKVLKKFKIGRAHV